MAKYLLQIAIFGKVTILDSLGNVGILRNIELLLTLGGNIVKCCLLLLTILCLKFKLNFTFTLKNFLEKMHEPCKVRTEQEPKSPRLQPSSWK